MSWIRKVKITQNRQGSLKYGRFLKALITIASRIPGLRSSTIVSIK